MDISRNKYVNYHAGFNFLTRRLQKKGNLIPQSPRRLIKRETHHPSQAQRPHQGSCHKAQAFRFVFQRGDGGEAGGVDQGEQHEAVGLHPIDAGRHVLGEGAAFHAVDDGQRTDDDFFGDEAEDERDGQLVVDADWVQDRGHPGTELSGPGGAAAGRNARWKIGQQPNQDHAGDDEFAGAFQEVPHFVPAAQDHLAQRGEAVGR